MQAITWNMPGLRGFSPVASVYVFMPLGVHFTSEVLYSFTNVAVSFSMSCGFSYFTPSSPASFVILDSTASVPLWSLSVTVTTTWYNAWDALTPGFKVLSASDSQISYVYVPGFV